jgi:hypothetical protein
MTLREHFSMNEKERKRSEQVYYDEYGKFVKKERKKE